MNSYIRVFVIFSLFIMSLAITFYALHHSPHMEFLFD